MHPEIRRNGSGSCPICGMALEPLQPAAQTERDPELRHMARRLWIGAMLAIPVAVLDRGLAMPMSIMVGVGRGAWEPSAVTLPQLAMLPSLHS